MLLQHLLVSNRALKNSNVQSELNNEHLRLSVRPKLIGHYHFKRNEHFSLEVENKGLGPAVINEWYLFNKSDSKPIGNNDDTLRIMGEIKSSIALYNTPFTVTTKKTDSILKPNEIWRVMTIHVEDIRNESIENNLKECLRNYSLKINYSSLYNESFEEHVR